MVLKQLFTDSLMGFKFAKSSDEEQDY